MRVPALFRTNFRPLRSTLYRMGISLLVVSGASAAAQVVTNFPGSTTVTQSSLPMTVTVTMTADGTAAAPQVSTQGLANGDFQLVAGGTCSAGVVYSVGQQCSVNVVFQPMYPGRRTGAVVVMSDTGALLGSALLGGLGIGPLPVLAPGQIDTVAGDWDWIFAGDGQPAIRSPIFLPTGFVVDGSGNYYLSDSQNNRIRRVDAQTGLMSTVGGNGSPGYEGNHVQATAAMVSTPSGLAMDGAGNLYVADTGNHIVRQIDAFSGVITTIAGTPTMQGYSGDGGLATAAQMSFPQNLAFDATGDLLIADTGNNVVRRVDAVTGIITTIAGTGVAGYNGDGQAATATQMDSPWSVAVGPDGSIYVADLFNNRVRKISVGGIMSTVAGGTRGFEGDGGPAAAAELSQPTSVALDPAGDLYIADSDNNRVREINAGTGIIDTICGTSGEQFLGDGAPANLASLYGPVALFVDPSGNLFLSDMFHNRIRRINALSTALTYATIKVGKVSPPQPVTVANEGNADLVLTAPDLLNGAMDPATTTCSIGADILAAGTCIVGAEFAPLVTGNPVNGSITVHSDSTSTAPVIHLSGEVLSITPTTLSLVSSKNPSLVGATVTFTATVDNQDSGTMGGTVTFFDSTTQLCSASIAISSASCSTTALTLGQHSITATYSGDANDAAATSGVLVQVVQQTATLQLAVSPNPVVVTASVALTLTATAPTGTPTGMVTFYDGTSAIGAAALSASGVAMISTAALTPGTHSLSVQYAGDATNAPGTSNTVSLVVQMAATATTLSTSNASAAVGAPVTFTASVTSTNGPVPTGDVKFTDSGVTMGMSALGSGGSATFTTSSLTPGPHSIAAVYSGDTDDATSTSATLTEVIQQISTATAIAATPNPTSAGTTVNLTATVTIAGGTGPAALTGKVTFTEGATIYGSAMLDGSGHATLGVSTLFAGSHSIVANYKGSTDYVASASAALVVVVNSTETTTALNSPATTTYAGQAASFTATVTSPTGVPTGAVSFMDGSASIGQGTLNAQGMASFSTATLSVGAHTLTAAYGGDGNYNASTSAPLLHTVSLAPTTTALSSSANPATLGASVTFTASVSSSSPSIGGTVNFFDGAAAIGSAAVGANGTATLSTAALVFGAHTITAVYQGDTTHATSTSAALNQRIVEAAVASLASSVNPAIYGNAFTLTTHVASPGSSSQVPTGSVIFRDGTSTLGTSTLDGTGSATFVPGTLAVGSHPLSVTYAGDINFSAASATLVETIQDATTQIALTASANPSTYLAAETFTATVTGNAGTATGAVTFLDGGTSIGTAQLNASGIGSITVTTLSPGPHSIVANYGGNADIGASSSTPLAISVKESTTMSLASNADPSLTLASFTLTADVMNSGAGEPTGVVTFMDGTTLLGTASLDATGHAALAVPSMSSGNHALEASYTGDADNFAGSSPTLTETVTLRPTTVALTGSATDAANPQQVTLIAVVGWTGPIAPTGTVSFANGSTVLGSAIVGPIGVALLTVTFPAQSESIVATYNGDAAYAFSASIATEVTLSAPTQLTMLLDPPAMTFASGQHSSGSVTLVSQIGFTDTMEFGCLGLPFAATCTFSKTQMLLAANGSVTVQLTVDTGDPLGGGASASVHGRSTGVMLCFLPVLLGIGLCARRRGRKLPTLLLVVVAATMTMAASGCSGLHINATPPGAYAFKVMATGVNTGTSQSQTMTLTVTQ